MSTHGKLSPAFRLSAILAAVTLIQSAVGAFYPKIFRDPAMTVGNARGTDVVILFVALPVLITSMIMARRSSLRAILTWTGALAYILYNTVLFAFAILFNPLFLFYIATFSLAVWSLVVLLAQLDVESFRDHFAVKTPVRFFAGYLVFICLPFIILWLKQIIPALFDPAPPAFLAGTAMLTSPVHVLDLGFTLPLGVLSAVWLWQRKSWGYMLTGLLITFMTIETASIAVDQYFGHIHDPAATPDAIPLFCVLTVIGFVVSATYLYFLRSTSKSNEGLA